MSFLKFILQTPHFIRVNWYSFKYRSFFDESYEQDLQDVIPWLKYKIKSLSGIIVDGKPTSEQEHAILCNKKRILCIAGPGSGKTRVLTHRIAHLLKNRGVHPDSVLAVTFTRKAATQMKERIKSILTEPDINVDNMQVSTFHSFCHKILQEHGAILLGEKYEIIDTKKQRKVLTYLTQENKIPPEELDLLYDKVKPGEGVEDFIDDCLDVINYMQNERVDLSTIERRSKKLRYERHIEIYKRMRAVVGDYFKFVEFKSMMDFNMLLEKTITLLKKHDNVLKRLQGRYDHILVDEYQDVNELQVELIRLLTTRENHLFVVGDDWQSIYGWRGSKVEYILNFGKTFPRAEAIKLYHNFRSTKNIVDSSNELIKHNKKLFKKKIRTSKPRGDKITILNGDGLLEECSKVIDKIKNLGEDGYGFSDMHVLLRTREARDILCDLLKESRIPYVKKERLSPEDEPDSRTADKVTVLTAHSAKGLENRIVFICGAGGVAGHFPCLNAKYLNNVLKGITDQTEQEEEERRLFYVAMTRTKEKLFITSVGYPEYVKQIPERYLQME